MNLRISKVFGSRGGATEIMKITSVQKWQFLAISEDWTNVYACCSFKIIINNECLIYIHRLDIFLIIYVTKIIQFHVSQFWHETGPISPFVVLALCMKLRHLECCFCLPVHIASLQSFDVVWRFVYDKLRSFKIIEYFVKNFLFNFSSIIGNQGNKFDCNCWKTMHCWCFKRLSRSRKIWF